MSLELKILSILLVVFFKKAERRVKAVLYLSILLIVFRLIPHGTVYIEERSLFQFF